jgi:cellobiose phosphorylase
MQFGYFDDKNREYVIDRPDTPRPWSNYLGSTEYGSIITGNAGGYSFYRSAAQGRFMRARLNTLPVDQPGRYLYLHDHESRDYWSISWQPCAKPLDRYKSECRHGTAYTNITSEYADIKAEALYFVPLGRTFEVWRVRVTNTSNRARSLSLFTYVEYVGNWNATDDQVNLQYTQYTLTMSEVDGIIDHGTNVNIPPMPDDFQQKDQGRHTFIGLAGADVAGFDTDREAFIGPHRSYGNPIVVERGSCTGSLAAGDNGCGVLETKIELAPGQTKELAVVLGIGKAGVEGKAAVSEFADQAHLAREFERVKKHWHDQLEGLVVKTPDPEFDSMLNMWCPYNNLITFAWSRAASLVYNGERDGLGFRDTVQDFMGITHNIPEAVRARLELMLTGQASTGGAMEVVKPFAHKPGHEPTPTHYRSDDCLWFFNAVPNYVKETGDLAFFDKVLPYCDKGEATVLGHLRRAIEFSVERSGTHGLPCGLRADWNDCLRLGEKGESVFVAFQLRLALVTYIEICERLDRPDEVKWAEPLLQALDQNLERHAWDGDWYLRAFRYDGMKFGSKECEEGSIFLNPQSWAVLSGHAAGERARVVMDQVREKLATEYGIQLCDPPFTDRTDWRVILATLMNAGMKENGGIFVHTQGWAVMAEAMIGRGARAYEYFRAFMPAAYNTRAEVRQIEPYVYCQSTHSKRSPRFGASRVPWLSGSATWAYYSAAQYVLGVRPEYDGLLIDPAVPGTFKQFSITRKFRGKTVRINVENPDGVEKGVRRVLLNGKELKGNLLPAADLREENDVTVVMGRP